LRDICAILAHFQALDEQRLTLSGAQINFLPSCQSARFVEGAAVEISRLRRRASSMPEIGSDPPSGFPLDPDESRDLGSPVVARAGPCYRQYPEIGH